MQRKPISRFSFTLEQLESRRLLACDVVPMAVDDAFETAEDSTLLISAAQGLLANDSSVDGTPFMAELVASPRHGSANVMPDGSFIYIPSANFFGVDSFTYIVAGECPSEPATVQIEVNNVHDPVFPLNDSYRVRPGDVLSLPALVGVLSNDLNPDRTELKAVLDQDVAGGELVLNADGSFRYDPLDFTGLALFSYRVDDGTELSPSARVALTVNSAPVALDDRYVVREDESLIISVASGVTANDSDAESDRLSVQLQTEPSNGTLEIDVDGSFIYTPAENFFGSDQFTYIAGDGNDSSQVATVNLVVEAINDLPVANADAYFVASGGRVDVDADSGLLANDTDVDSSELSVEILESVSHGQLTIDRDGSFAYESDADFTGEDSFTYSVRDEENTSPATTVTLFVGTSPIRISEFLAANTDSLETRRRDEPDDRFRGADENPDWLELENLTDAAFDVGGFHLSDDPNNPALWTIPANTIVPPNGHLIVFASGRDVTDSRLDELGYLHSNFTISIKPSVLQLVFPNGRIAQSIEYPEQFAGVSYGQSAAGDFGYMARSTPLESNGTIFESAVEPVTFSQERGFYESAFQLSLSSDTPNAEIRYTLDGSAPTNETGSVYVAPLSIDTTTTLRAAAFKPNHVASQVVTNSYLFLNDVLEQPFQREGYPDEWGGMPADYGMDPDVIGVDNLFNDTYRDSVIEDLKTLPTLSLSFDSEHLFGNRGIYQRPTSTGDDWERPVAVEYISPDGSEPGFHLNSGVRVMGGSSRQTDIPKHSFRLEFREAYGAGKLEYPLFDDAPFSDGVTDTFDELVVRVGFNNSWMHRHYYQSLRGEQPRDQWVRDLHASMGHPGARGHYVHVYLNGMYWGIYNLHERPAAPYMEEYFGGDKDTEWNVINSNEAIDGELRPWSTILAQANRGLSTEEEYEAFESEVDVVSLADYMLLNFYVGNTDWDGHNWISARRNTDDKWRFYAWDSEFAISLPPSNAAVGESAERQITNVDRTSQNAGNGPSRLHSRASTNDEYRLLFADRIHKHFFNGGTLSPETATKLFTARTDEIDRAVVAESARWGDFRRDVNPGRWRSDQFDLYHRDEHYVNQREFIVERYLPVRAGIVLEQLKRRRLYPDVVAPQFNQHGGRVDKPFSLSIEAPEGVIYVTTDGSDPRARGGDVSDSAQVYESPFALNVSTTVKARVLLDGDWSALNEAYFQIADAASAENFRVTEVNYHPSAPTENEIAAGFSDADEFEFIELENIADVAIDISNVSLIRVSVGDRQEGIDFAFAKSDTSELAPGERIVVVENIAAFAHRYGADILVAGQWSGQLGNGGEMITVAVGNEVIQQFTYDDEWYPDTDGAGSTLEIIDAAGALDSWDTSIAWRAVGNGGTPGTGSNEMLPGDSNLDGIFNSADLVLVFQAAEYEDAIQGNSTFAEGDWNGDGDFTTSDLVFAFQTGKYIAALKRL